MDVDEHVDILGVTLTLSLIILPPIHALMTNNIALWIFWLAYLLMVLLAMGRANRGV